MYGDPHGLSYMLDPRFIAESFSRQNESFLKAELIDTPLDKTTVDDVPKDSWGREWELCAACLFIPKGSFHLLLLITIVLITTRRDLVVAAERGPCLVRAVHS
jgi:hypothetical protein